MARMIRKLQARVEQARRDDSGFTLIEMVVAVAILIAVVAGLALVFTNVFDTGAKGSCSAERDAIVTAQQVKKAQTGSYATTYEELITGKYLKSGTYTGWTLAGGGGVTLNTSGPCMNLGLSNNAP